jgi:energy-coupling factor transporter ATP-binding protein EcfA2
VWLKTVGSFAFRDNGCTVIIAARCPSGGERGRYAYQLRQGYLMIRSIEVRHFRCFDHLKIADSRRINVIVGDNGSGKTALLEALFLALGTTTELALRYRQQRGLGVAFSGSSRMIEEAFWKDLFHKRDWTRVISVELAGDAPEARQVRIVRGSSSQLSIPIGEDNQQNERVTAPITFEWRDSSGTPHLASPKISGGRLEFPSTDEDMPDFFFFAANQIVSTLENAERFSALSRASRLGAFVDSFTAEYDWIKDLSLEVVAGAPMIYATVAAGERLPLPNVSAGINRLVSIMLSIASRARSIVLVDEAENGIYYRHHRASWAALLSFARQYDSQLFLSTHSEEWLEALVDVADDMSDVALWRIERTDAGTVIRQFSGETFRAGIETGGEVR